MQQYKEITLGNLALSTEQEVFNHVASRLKAQNFQTSREVSGFCAYRGKKGLKCAAGHCMTDDEYSTAKERYCRKHNLSKENHLFEVESWLALAKDGIVPTSHAELIAELQEAHDVGVHSEDMQRNLINLAIRHKLSADVLQVTD